MTMYHSIYSILLNSPIDTPNTSVAPQDPHLHGWMQFLIAYIWFEDGDLNSLEDIQQNMNKSAGFAKKRSILVLTGSVVNTGRFPAFIIILSHIWMNFKHCIELNWFEFRRRLSQWEIAPLRKNVIRVFGNSLIIYLLFDIYVTEYGTALTTILPILFLYLNTVTVTAGTFEP